MKSKMKKIFLIVSLVWMSAMALAQNTQDTIRMEVIGTSAEFSFTAGKTAMYCVDWGDGNEEKQACTAGEEKTLTHTYTASNAYDITFFVYKEQKCVPIREKRGFIDLVWVEGGTFTMGCTDEQGEDCAEWEKPKHQVTLDGFYIGKYEITQAEYKQVMGKYPSGINYFISKGDSLPMEQVTWSEAKVFCDSLSKQTGETYTLPTEAQWEFAARGGNKSMGYKYSGSDDLDDVAWYWDETITDPNKQLRSHEVGTKCPNELGIYDMSGNVHEWCLDGNNGWDPVPYKSNQPVVNPPAASGTHGIMRGGPYNMKEIYENIYNGTKANMFRVSWRGATSNTSRGFIGIRVVKVPKKTE